MTDSLPAGSEEPSPQSMADVRWDAGDLGCGDLVLQLKIRMARLQPGQVMWLTTRDPGAAEDIPAWCQMTGHRLVQASHPEYRIQRKKD